MILRYFSPSFSFAIERQIKFLYPLKFSEVSMFVIYLQGS